MDVSLAVLLKNLFKLWVFTFFGFVFAPAVQAEHTDKPDYKPLAKKLIYFELPSQTLKRGLVAFGLQADVNIIVPANLLSGHQSRAVVGRYSVERALQIFLSHTSFSYEVIDLSHTVVLVLPAKLGKDVSEKTIDEDGSEYEKEIEDVLVVSARHRNENLLKVPIALTLLGGAAMEKQGVQDLVQLGDSLINTTLKVARGSNATLVAYIRGIGQSDPVAGFEQGVGVYVDDVYFNRPQGAVLDIYDVDRIEVLRGPQGTLYGRNTIGGAIKYVTRRLSDEPALSVKASLGSYRQSDLIVTASLPIADGMTKVGGSIALFKRDGFGKNLETGQQHYDKDIMAARASAEITPIDELLIRMTLDYTDDKSAPRPGYRTIESDLERDTSGNIYQPLGNIFDTRAGAANTGHPVNKNTQEAFGSSLSVDYSLSNEWSFKSITAYREDKQESPIDFDGLPGNSFDTYVRYENDQLSQEFRWGYESADVQGIVGFYYLDARAFDVFDVVLGTTAGGITSFTLGDIDTATWAIFFDANFRLSDTVDFSLGARYSSDRRTALIVKNVYEDQLVSPFFAGARPDLSQLTTYFKGRRTDTAFTPRISISWHPSSEMLIYGSYSQGFKGGGFDPRGAFSTEEQRKGYAPESVDAYELGFKSSYYDGLISSRLAAFYSDYRNIQIQGSIAIDSDDDGVTDDFLGSITNAARASISGFEYELSANISDSFNASLAVGLLNAQYDEYLVVEEIFVSEAATLDSDGSAVLVDQGSGEFELVDVSEDRNFHNTPETSVSLVLSYKAPLGAGELSMITSANYTSRVYQSEVEFLIQEGYTLFNSSVVWTSDNEQWQLGFHALNISNKKYINAGYNFPSLGEGSASTFYGNPRTLTASVNYSF